jgi:uncharacterized protein (UPF0335 family)
MARRARKDKAAEGNGGAVRANGLDSDLTKSFLDRVLNLYGDLNTERGTYMRQCKDIREDMAAIFDEAKDKGIPMRALKGAVKKRLLEMKIEKIRDDLDGEELDNYDMVLQALGDYGDTPLGRAALDKAPPAAVVAAAAAAPVTGPTLVA